MNQLPDEIILSIFDWIQDDPWTRKSFVKINKAFACTFMKKVVMIKIGLIQLMKLNEQKRSILLERSESLDFYDVPSIPLNVDVKGAYSIRSNRVELVSRLEKVHILTVPHCRKSQLPDILVILHQKTILKSLTVKEVVLMEGESEEINVIEGLEVLRIYNFNKLKVAGLNLHAYTSLKTVVLENCSNIDDVSGLDGIYNVMLKRCHNVKDISCLNHNHRITIDYCRGITDYSKSFRHSHYISLANIQLEILPSFPEVKSLSLTEVKLQHLETTLALPNRLQFLSLRNTAGFERLGPNALQKVCISRCEDFQLLDNMGNIRIVELEYLELTSLSGLSANNKIVRLSFIQGLQDINVLKECEKIEIKHSGNQFLETVINFQQLKELTLSLMIENSLQIFLESNFQSPNLQVLELMLPNYVVYDASTSKDFRRLVELYSTVKKFTINVHNALRIINEFLIELFVIDSIEVGKLNLLRK